MTTGTRSDKSFILCVYMKTIRADQDKGMFIHFVSSVLQVNLLTEQAS